MRMDREGRDEDFLAREIATMAEAHLKPKLIFWRCLDLMARERVQLPGEHRLTALIATALQCRKQQLIERIDRLLTADLRTILDDLFVQAMPSDDGTEPGRTSRYRLTLLKKLSQSTKAGEIRPTSISWASTTSPTRSCAIRLGYDPLEPPLDQHPCPRSVSRFVPICKNTPCLERLIRYAQAASVRLNGAP